MNSQMTRFNQLLLIVLVVLFLVTLGQFTYLNMMLDEGNSIWPHVLNALILSMPLVLLYGSLYILVRALREKRMLGQMSPRIRRAVHLGPRIAAIVIVFFVTLFSLDVFGGKEPFLQQLGAFFIHSLPSITMILLLVIAWNRPVVGFAAFLLAGVFFLRFVLAGRFDPLNFLLFSGPLLCISALFYLDWRWNRPPALLSGEAGDSAQK